MTTPFMSMTLPIVSLSVDYVDVLNSDLDIYDAHNHVSSGNILTQDSISWVSIDMNANYIKNAKSLSFENDNSITYTSSIFVKNYELNFMNSDSDFVQITNNGYVNAQGVYNGFYGDMNKTNAVCEYKIFYYSGSTNYYGYLFQSGSTVISQSNVICSEFITSNSGAMIVYDLVVNSNLTINSQISMYTDANINLTNFTEYFYIDETGYFACCQLATNGANVLLKGTTSMTCYPEYLYLSKVSTDVVMTQTTTTTNSVISSIFQSIIGGGPSTIYSFTGYHNFSTSKTSSRSMMKCYDLINDIFDYPSFTLTSDMTSSYLMMFQRYMLLSNTTGLDYYGHSSSLFSVCFQVPTQSNSTNTLPPHIPVVVTPTIVWASSSVNPSKYQCAISQTCTMCKNVASSTALTGASYGNYYFVVNIYDTENGVFITSGFYLMIEVFALASTSWGI